MTQVQILSGLTHPSIVKLVGVSVGVGPTSPIMLTEFLENQDVESLRLKPGFAFMVILDPFWPYYFRPFRGYCFIFVCSRFLEGKSKQISHITYRYRPNALSMYISCSSRFGVSDIINQSYRNGEKHVKLVSVGFGLGLGLKTSSC